MNNKEEREKLGSDLRIRELNGGQAQKDGMLVGALVHPFLALLLRADLVAGGEDLQQVAVRVLLQEDARGPLTPSARRGNLSEEKAYYLDS